MPDPVRSHYEKYPYPRYPLLASVRRCDGYAINLTALWTEFNGELPPVAADRILVAGCGSFAPYPFSVANPESEITALDLSEKSLKRARLHCLLHGRRNVRFESGSLLDPERAGGPFGMVDAYGVIHHLDDPSAGLAALASRLADGAVLRLMVYSRYARREEESIRRALRLLRVASPDSVRKLAERAGAGSRFKGYLSGSPEAGFREGLADALLHPCVHTFRIDELLEMIQESGLELLRFAHGGALEDVTDEIGRIRQLEAERESPGNFLVYLGRKVKGGCGEDERSYIMLNPCLKEVTAFLSAGGTSVAPRLGRENLPLGWSERRFLARFRDPVQLASLSQEMRLRIREYRRRLFLLSFHL